MMLKCLVLLLSTYVVSLHGTAPSDIVDMMNSECSVDLAFVLDASGSVGTNNWKTMIDFVKAFANLLPLSPETNQIGVISFGNDASLHIALNGYSSHTEFNNSMDDIVYMDENTNTAAGLRLLRTKMFTESGGDRLLKPNIAIVLTDGKPTYEINETTPEANLVKNAGTFVFAIGIGAEGINVDELVVIASDPESKFVFRILKFEDLTALLLTILEEVCKIEMETGTVEPAVCNDKDIVFLLDSSGSVQEKHWENVKDFIINMLGQITIGPANTQIGIVVFSTESFVYSLFGQHNSHSDIASVVQDMPWIDQRTNTSGALRLARDSLFTVEYGDRDSYPNLIILISDGKSNTDEELTIPEAEATRNSGIRILSIGVGLEANMAELEGISSRPQKFHTFLVEEFSQLVRDGETAIFDAVCTDTYPEKQPDVAAAGCTSDVLFILDATSAIGLEAFFTVKETLQDVLQEFNFPGNRIAFIPFGTNPYLIPFNYFPVEYINSPIDQLRFLDGVGFNVQSLGPEIDQAIRQRRIDVTMPVILITATAPKVGDGTEALFRNLKEKTQSPVFAVVLGADTESIGQMITSNPVKNFLFEVEKSLAHTMEYVLKMSCLSSAQVIYYCDFENSNGDRELCDITQSVADEMDWSHKEGNTPSRLTGPAKAFSLPYYLYIEASGKQKGDDAVLFLPITQQSKQVYCIYFAYHMYGFHIGSLQVLHIQDNRERIVWMKYGQQSEEWEYSQVGVSLQPSDKVGFRAVRGEAHTGDIALDSLVVRSGPCPDEYSLDSL